tara:strand:+ start:1146 stop:2513 length:1368 start_codon:yes stop_codon:yes gene_type:complete
MLGGLIKGIGGIFGLDSPAELSGFKAGLAGSISKGIDKSVDRYADRVDRIADYQLRKRVAEEERFTSEYQENIKKLKAMKGQMGDAGVEGLAFLVSKYGIDGAEKEVGTLRTLADRTGRSTTSLLGMERNENFGMNVSDLAKISTRPVADYSDLGEGIEAPGIIGLFGGDVQRDVSRQYDRGIQELNITTDTDSVEFDNLPTATGIDPITRGMLSSPSAEAGRLRHIGHNYLEEAQDILENAGSNAEARAMAEAKKQEGLALIKRGNDMAEIFDTDKDQNMTTAGTRAAATDFKSQINDVFGLGGVYQDGIVVTGDMNEKDFGKLNILGSKLARIQDNAVRSKNYTAAEAYATISEAIASNQSIEFDMESGQIIVGSIGNLATFSAQQAIEDENAAKNAPAVKQSPDQIVSLIKASNDTAEQIELQAQLIDTLVKDNNMTVEAAKEEAQRLIAGQ